METIKDVGKGSLVRVGLGYLLIMTLLVLLGGVLYGLSSKYFDWPDLALKQLVLWCLGAWFALIWFCPVILLAWDRLAFRLALRAVGPDTDAPISPLSPASILPDPSVVAPLRDYLRNQYGFFWRRQVRLLLVMGEPAQVDAIAPGLSEQTWLHGQDTVLLWGGTVPGDGALFAQWHGVSRWRGLDGVVWALSTPQSLDATSVSAAVQRLLGLARDLHWQLPLYLWQVCDSDWPQPKRVSQAVGCRLPAHVTLEQLEQSLGALTSPLRQHGLAQLQEALTHDFLLRLSRDLQREGIARWRQVLAPLLGELARGVPLRGVWFSLAQYPKPSELQHHWPYDPAWQGVLDDKPVNRRLGWSTPRVAYALVLGVAALWGAGLLLSFVNNRAQIAQVHTSLVALQHSAQGDAQFKALHELMRELGRLDYRAAHGVPWYQRFGLNQNPELLNALWPRYVEAHHRLMRDPGAAVLQQQLSAMLKLPPGSAERAERAHEAYDALKAYLMMARPEKVDAAFLADALGKAEPLRAGISPGLWQSLSANLWQFYAQQLAAHPHWRIEADPALIAQARQVLLGQLGQRNGDANLYQQVLDATALHYPAITLQQMVGDTDAQALFSTDYGVAGVFTRQAWEGHVRAAINDIAQARREEIDWVLSDKPGDIDPDTTPDVLRERLTQRYFQDYSRAWLAFLSSLRWQPAGSLAHVIDQLTLMSDVRQSPLIALMNTLAYQGQAGTRSQALTDALMKSAQTLMAAATELPNLPGPEASGPLDATFGPLLALLGKDPQHQSDNEGLTLQAFLNRVTRVRLKLQQVSNAPDPQAMTQALAQTVFQGKSVDLTDTRAYGDQIAASLGAEWGVVGQTLFVQPLEQAWQRVLQPSAAGLNTEWQRGLVRDWQRAFTGRYPFALTASDASLPMLGQMIRSDSGRIEQFIQRQLSGVLRKEGSRWVADPRQGQGLRLNPGFVRAINQLSHLADVLYTDGGMGLSFELRGKAARNVVQTTFIHNGERHAYFNQKERWQHFNWPGRSDYPGASLRWTSVTAGERLYGDYPGTWGLIRLLEAAHITALDDSESEYRMVLKAPDGLDLTWHLRTELGAGPMALLALRGFTLPSQIFLDEGAATQPYVQNGRSE